MDMMDADVSGSVIAALLCSALCRAANVCESIKLEAETPVFGYPSYAALNVDEYLSYGISGSLVARLAAAACADCWAAAVDAAAAKE